MHPRGACDEAVVRDAHVARLVQRLDFGQHLSDLLHLVGFVFITELWNARKEYKDFKKRGPF